MANPLLDKLRKNSTIKEMEVLATSQFFTNVNECPTKVYGINIALSGSLTGGLKRGLTIVAGPSRHFKSLFCLLMAKAYMDKHPEAVLIFYDSEFGTPNEYFNSVGIDMTRVLHCPITDIEQFKHELMVQVQGLNRGDKAIILVDSIGNLASKKEVDDAIEGKNVADMTRAKALKSLFRMVTPHLTIKDIPMVAINHIYMDMGMYPKAIMGGGQGPMLAADNVWIVSRSQEKDGTETIGYSFNINIEKSRFVREKSRIPIVVNFEGGLSVYSGLMQIALDAGMVIKPKAGWYQKIDPSTGEIEPKNWRLADCDCGDFWKPLIASTQFQEYVCNNYKVTTEKLITDDELDATLSEGDD